MSLLNTFAITLMVTVFVAVSLVMALAPNWVAEYVRGSKGWRRYLRFVPGIEEGDITAARLRIRLQGVIGLVFSIFLCMALLQRFMR